MKNYKIAKYLLMVLAIIAIKCECNKISDSDGDGIEDVKDQCPNTKVGETVNKQGCSPLDLNDLDRDGVPNNEDNCPNTPKLSEGMEVDSRGCIPDAVSFNYNPPSGIVEIKNQIILSGLSRLTAGEIQSLKDSLEKNNDNDDVIVETCPCDKDIQLWTLPDGFDLNNAISSARSKGGKKLDGDKNYIFDIVEENSSYGIFHEPVPDINLLNDKNKPILAVLDSGLDTKQLNFAGLQLLNTREINGQIYCEDSIATNSTSNFGWNFVDMNSDMSEDYSAHGTNVTKTLLKSLKSTGLSQFQLLPLKLFDKEGMGSYWNVVCAFSYLTKLDSLGYDIALINTSFSGKLNSLAANQGKNNDQKDLMVLKQYLDKLSKSLVIASAGNSHSNNDENPNFPSSYKNEKWFDEPLANLISVAGYNNGSPRNLFVINENEEGSNYGPSTVDIAAPWHFTIFEEGEDINNSNVKGLELVGTSFSTPQVAASLLDYYFKKKKTLRGEDLKNDFLHNSKNIKTNRSLKDYLSDGKYID